MNMDGQDRQDGGTKKGSCLCGVVQIAAQAVSGSIGACHCTMCRKWGGGPLMATECGTEVSFAGEENITVFNSSDWAERGFCKQCGSHLFYRLKHSGEYFMPAGLFEDDEGFELTHQVFIDQKPSWYAFANETEDMTAQEVFEKYAPPAE
jgi:hypothetical protein